MKRVILDAGRWNDMTYTGKLVHKIVTERFEDLAPAAVAKMKQAILDDIGCAFMGYEMGYGKILSAYAKDAGERQESTIIGDGERVFSGLAAGVNAQFSYDSNYEETGPGGHAFSTFAKTGIAVAEREGATGKDLITSVALAYELNGHFYTSLKPGASDRFGGLEDKRHTIACVTICAGKLLNLSEKQLNYALGLEWLIAPPSSAFSFRQDMGGNMGSMCHVMICPIGVQAALLAQKGYEGPLHAFDKDILYDLDSLVDMNNPSPYYYVVNKLQLKPWVAALVSGGALELVSGIVNGEAIKPQDIQEIVVRSRPFYCEWPFNCAEPTNYYVAHYSVPWLISMALLVGLDKSGPEWFAEERMKDPSALALAKKVKIVKHEAAGDLWSGDLMAGRTKTPMAVEVRSNGRTYNKETTAENILGSSKRPLSKEQIEGKFKRLASRIIGEEQSREIVELMDQLEELDDIRELARLFKAR
jgi:2-methylcitrate dehydratase PrpD